MMCSIHLTPKNFIVSVIILRGKLGDGVAIPSIRGSFEKSVQSPRVDATGACRGYLQLVVSLGITHNKFQPDRSISLCLAFV